MFPLKDNIRARTKPVLSYLIIAANIAFFLYELSLGDSLHAFLTDYGLVSWKMTKGISHTGLSASQHLLPWLSHMFLHGGWVHLLTNMWFLYVFGDNVEDRLGKARYAVLFVCGGLMAGLMQILSSPGDQAPMVGASGAVSAVLAAYLLFYPKAWVWTLVVIVPMPVPAFVFILIWFAVQVMNGSSLFMLDQASGVAWWAHIGGFLAGLVLANVLKPTGPPPDWRGGRRRSAFFD